jgi:hypothetical protein
MGGKMERSYLRRRMAMKYADLDPILEELVKEGKIYNFWTIYFITMDRKILKSMISGLHLCLGYKNYFVR